MLTEFPPFRPKRFLRSGHAQTLAAFVLRGRQSDYSAKKYTVPLDDGDRLVIHDDQPENWITGDRIAILFHGLCGCHRAPYVVRAADKLQRQGIRTIRVDMRGFGDSTFISKSHLHGGCSEDAVAVIDYIHRLSPLSPISLIGYSIGGNIVLRTVGKWGQRPHSQVDSVVAICPPVDLLHCASNLRQRGNRIYETYFVRKMSEQLLLRRRKVEGLVDTGVSPLPSRLIHFDDQFTAPCWGYQNAIEYYRDASSAPYLENVSVPTIILTSKDDPVVPFSMFENHSMSDYIDLVSPDHGGHLGFLASGRSDPDRHWMDWRICQWIAALGDNLGSELSTSTNAHIPAPHRTGSYSILR